MANSYNTHGDLVTPYEIGCEMQRKRIECAIMIASMVDEDELTTDFIIPDALNRLLPLQMSQAIVNKFGD